MPRRKKVALPAHPTHWVVTKTFTWNGRHIEPGQELTITGLRGRAKFIEHIDTGTTEWIDVRHKTLIRAVRPERIKTVHRIKKLRPAS